MDQAKEFHNLDDTSDGLFRELGPGVTTRIFSGEQAMLSGRGPRSGPDPTVLWHRTGTDRPGEAGWRALLLCIGIVARHLRLR